MLSNMTREHDQRATGPARLPPSTRCAVTGAELAARRTAASALRADFKRESYAYAMENGPVPDWVTWAQRLSLALAGLLEGV